MPIGEEQKLRRALNTFASTLPPADRVALVTVPHGGIKVGLTTDRERLRAGIAQISPIQSIMDPPCQTRDTLATLEAPVAALRPIRLHRTQREEKQHGDRAWVVISEWESHLHGEARQGL